MIFFFLFFFHSRGGQSSTFLIVCASPASWNSSGWRVKGGTRLCEWRQGRCSSLAAVSQPVSQFVAELKCHLVSCYLSVWQRDKILLPSRQQSSSFSGFFNAKSKERDYFVILMGRGNSLKHSPLHFLLWMKLCQLAQWRLLSGASICSKWARWEWKLPFPFSQVRLS